MFLRASYVSSDLEKANQRRRVSFARQQDMAKDAATLLAEIKENSDSENSDSDCDASDESKAEESGLFNAPLATHKINEDLFVLNEEIETKEEHIKMLVDQDDNPHLIRAKVRPFMLLFE